MQFNARSESVSEKASFHHLVPNNRCLVAVEGFYEWKKDGTKKQPYYIHFNDQRPLVFAALYDYWENLEDRLPVILGNKSAMDAWLNGCPSFEVESVLKSYEDPDLVWYPVTPEMGKPSFNGPECIKEIQLKPVEKYPFSKFFFKTSEIKCESFPEVKSSTEEATQTNQFEDVKEEPTTHVTKEGVLDFGGHGTDDKLEVQSLLKEGAENVEPNGTTNSLQWTQSFLILSRCHH
ncbi:putative SOS response-associated peptidase YoqW isoform X1 [Cinnamomum micranthum f. kanehirae]|uniref:Putative SOS response-associated peptidase YoqW isoform X1 n=1 Tax=Cinnamomum micranthum f. kanehirae TaxID=337451 RepID=A0A443P8V3_9MAGN|nr:putative SOS response-associated peptidase YoqW isoform X1 [Cinnamomum micranthum f. kanehirae]